MRHEALADVNCSIARSLSVLGERWTLVVLRQAFLGARRFEDYQRGLGIARNILTDRLRTLVEHDILERRRYHERPPRYEYRLTQKGRDLYPILVSLMQWGDTYAGSEPGPPVLLRHKGCGEITHPHLVCSECNEPIDARAMQPEAGPGAIADAAA